MDFIILLGMFIIRVFSLFGSQSVEAQSIFDICPPVDDQCPNANIKFWLYRNNTEDPLEIDPSNPIAESFNSSLPLIILLHGFKGNQNLSPNLELRPVLLQTQPVHVLSLDYGPLVVDPYQCSVDNLDVVAKCLAQFLDNLVESGIYRSDQIHLKGFSLGAQLAGITANHVRNRLNRITALDPAGPRFSMYFTSNLSQKLDPSDARFIDVIHTDPLVFGLLDPVGHADFYPNLRYLFQPGCGYWEDGTIRNCNHFRACEYYAESITTTRGFWSYPCGSWWELFLMSCNNYLDQAEVPMGYFVPENASGAYFLTTAAEPPFAKGKFADVSLVVSNRVRRRN